MYPHSVRMRVCPPQWPWFSVTSSNPNGDPPPKWHPKKKYVHVKKNKTKNHPNIHPKYTPSYSSPATLSGCSPRCAREMAAMRRGCVTASGRAVGGFSPEAPGGFKGGRKDGKILGKSWENWENHGKIMGKLGKSWENGGKKHGGEWETLGRSIWDGKMMDATWLNSKSVAGFVQQIHLEFNQCIHHLAVYIQHHSTNGWEMWLDSKWLYTNYLNQIGKLMFSSHRPIAAGGKNHGK